MRVLCMFLLANEVVYSRFVRYKSYWTDGISVCSGFHVSLVQDFGVYMLPRAKTYVAWGGMTCRLTLLERRKSV